MTKEEFLEKIHSYGINLNLYSIAMGYRTDRMYYSGIYQDNGKWIVYQVGDQNRVVILYEGTEEEAYEELYDILFVLIRSEGYINQSITKNVIQTSEANVCRFLKDKYVTNKIIINDTWNYLKWDFHVLNELKYFALYNKFVPEDDCYKVQGYSAQDVHNLLGSNIFDSFVYLIKLEKDDSNEYLTRLESAKKND